MTGDNYRDLGLNLEMAEVVGMVELPGDELVKKCSGNQNLVWSNVYHLGAGRRERNPKPALSSVVVTSHMWPSKFKLIKIKYN